MLNNNNNKNVWLISHYPAGNESEKPLPPDLILISLTTNNGVEFKKWKVDYSIEEIQQVEL